MHDIESVVETKLLAFLESHREQLLLRTEHQQDPTTQNELAQLRSQEENLFNQLESLSIIDPLVESYQKRLRKVADKIAELENKLKIENELALRNNRVYHVYDLIKRWDNLSIEEKHVVAAACIDRVLVSDSEIEIEFKFE